MPDTIEHDLTPLFTEIDRIAVGMVTTRDGNVMRGRPMRASADAAEEAIYLYSRDEDHKLVEIDRVPDVEIAFVDSEREVYISVSGRATVMRDRGKALEHASREVLAWFENGVDDPALRLIRVEVRQAERWDVNTNPVRKMWELERSLGSDHTPDLTDNVKYEPAP